VSGIRSDGHASFGLKWKEGEDPIRLHRLTAAYRRGVDVGPIPQQWGTA
jgi:hypothetical protein